MIRSFGDSAAAEPMTKVRHSADVPSYRGIDVPTRQGEQRRPLSPPPLAGGVLLPSSPANAAAPGARTFRAEEALPCALRSWHRAAAHTGYRPGRTCAAGDCRGVAPAIGAALTRCSLFRGTAVT